MTVYKIVEVVATSNTSFSDAVRGAVQRSAATLQDLSWFEVKELRGRIVDGVVGEFQAKVDLGFMVHAPAHEKETGDATRQHREGPTRQAASAKAQAAAAEGVRHAKDLAHGRESSEP